MFLIRLPYVMYRYVAGTDCCYLNSTRFCTDSVVCVVIQLVVDIASHKVAGKTVPN